jgi:hypothetical protein
LIVICCRHLGPRPVLEQALEFVREGDALVVTKLDRLARSVVHLGQIIEQLTAKGVSLRILSMGACRKVCQQAEKRAGGHGFQAGFPSEGPIRSNHFRGHFQTLRQALISSEWRSWLRLGGRDSAGRDHVSRGNVLRQHWVVKSVANTTRDSKSGLALTREDMASRPPTAAQSAILNRKQP